MITVHGMSTSGNRHKARVAAALGMLMLALLITGASVVLLLHLT